MGHRELVLTNWSSIIIAEAIEGGFSAVPYLVLHNFSRSRRHHRVPLGKDWPDPTDAI
jgi:hypothetical protein